MPERVEQDVPIRLYRFKGRTRWRWAARLGAVESYGALPADALAELARSLNGDDQAALLAVAESRERES